MLTIKDVLIVLRAYLKWIILSGLAFAVAFGLYTHFFVQPIYTSTASLYVINNNRTNADNITTGELTASQKLVKTYMVVLKSNNTMHQIEERLNALGYTLSISQISQMISTSSINDTEAFQIKAESADPELARTVVMIVLEVLPAEIIRVVDAGAVRIIDEASYPGEPYYPITKNIMAGGAVGVILSLAIVLLITVFDTKVHGDEKLKEIFDIPIIGHVPSFDDVYVDKRNARPDKKKRGSK